MRRHGPSPGGRLPHAVDHRQRRRRRRRLATTARHRPPTGHRCGSRTFVATCEPRRWTSGNRPEPPGPSKVRALVVRTHGSGRRLDRRARTESSTTASSAAAPGGPATSSPRPQGTLRSCLPSLRTLSTVHRHIAGGVEGHGDERTSSRSSGRRCLPWHHRSAARRIRSGRSSWPNRRRQPYGSSRAGRGGRLAGHTRRRRPVRMDDRSGRAVPGGE